MSTNPPAILPATVKPYYADEAVTLYCGHYRDVLAAITSEPTWPREFGWADCIMADPPYGETSLAWDSWPDGWPSDLLPYLSPNGSMWCFGSFRMFLDRRGEFGGYRMSHEIIWEKHNGSGFLNDRFRRVHELAAHFHPASSRWAEIFKCPQFTHDARKRVVRKKEKPAQWHGKTGSTTYVSEDGGPRLMRSVIQVRSCHGSALNETEKPQGIIRPLLQYACPPGGIVLVPFAGSGSDLLAAKHLGLRAIGFELREQQCEVAANRLRQGVLFGRATP